MDRAEGCARKDRTGVRDGPQGNAKALVDNKKQQPWPLVTKNDRRNTTPTRLQLPAKLREAW